MSFIEKIHDFIRHNRLMDKNKKYLVALSGGADSVSLILALKELGFDVDAVHCNFHLRGKESERDEQFCISLCKKKGIEIHIVHFNTMEYAALHKISIEMAARNLRYAYFEQLRNDICADGICVGHHREDSVETLLINLIRGTGINGLTGINPKNGFILRPMLCVSRADIEKYLNDKGQDFVTDSTNLIDDVTRNKIRLNLMPLIRSINPSADKDIANTANRINEAAKVFNNAIEKAADRVSTVMGGYTIINIPSLLNEISPEYTLYNILSRFSFSPATIEDIYNKLQTQVQSGKIFSSATHRILIDRNDIIVEPIDKGTDKRMTVPECGTYVYSETTKLRIKETEIDGSFKISREKHVASFDATKVKFPIKIRKTEKGDWFVPFGMNGKKLISDYLTDRKVSLFDKQRQLVITDADENIIWIVGERPDNRFKIESGSAKALVIELVKN